MNKINGPLSHSLLSSQIYPQWRLSRLRSLSIRQICFENCAYSLSLCKCECYSSWPWPKFSRSWIWNINISATVCTIATIRHTTFTEVGIRHRMAHCASNIFLLLIKRLLLGDALATITDTMDRFCSAKNLVLSESKYISQDLHFNPVFNCTKQCHQLKYIF